MMNLRKYVQDVMASAKSLEYGDIAADVLAGLPPEEYASALAQALPTYVRQVGNAQHAAGRVNPPAQDPIPGSWKVTAIRDNWQRRLLEIYATPDGNKRIGDMGRGDLLFLADTLQRQAKQKLSKSKGWRELADLLESEKVERVRDLPAELLMKAMGVAA